MGYSDSLTAKSQFIGQDKEHIISRFHSISLAKCSESWGEVSGGLHILDKITNYLLLC